MLFPELRPYFISKKDRELGRNIENMRSFIQELIQERKLSDEKNGYDPLHHKDFLSILIHDPIFQDEMIVDECLTFFLAGSQTTAVTTANAICYMLMKPEIEKKLRNSLTLNFENYKKREASLEELANEITLETLDMAKDDYIKMCFNESLRIEPPVSMNTTVCLTEDQDICGVKIRSGQALF